MTEGPLLWYVNRSTGLVLLVLLTATLLLGVWSTRGEAGGRVPGFVTQAVHRNVGLLSMTMLAVHLGSAVVDEYVDIRWWQTVLPWDLHYQAWWLALGVVSFDLLVAVSLTSLLRHHLDHRSWWLLHLATYPTWAIAVAHGLGIGTDSGAGWARWTYAGCGAVVVLSLVLRVVGSRRRRLPLPRPVRVEGAR